MLLNITAEQRLHVLKVEAIKYVSIFISLILIRSHKISRYRLKSVKLQLYYTAKLTVKLGTGKLNKTASKIRCIKYSCNP
jgi:hypothetical protein